MHNKLSTLFFSLSILINIIAGCKNYKEPQDVDQANRELPLPSNELVLGGMEIPANEAEEQKSKYDSQFTTHKNEKMGNSTEGKNRRGVFSDKKSPLEKGTSKKDLNKHKTWASRDSFTYFSKISGKDALEENKDSVPKSKFEFEFFNFFKGKFKSGKKEAEVDVSNRGKSDVGDALEDKSSNTLQGVVQEGQTPTQDKQRQEVGFGQKIRRAFFRRQKSRSFSGLSTIEVESIKKVKSELSSREASPRKK